MTSLEPRTSGEALGSALAIAMALSFFAAQTFRRARSGSRATECLQQNSLQSTQACSQATAEKAAMQRLRSGQAGRPLALTLPPPLRRPHAPPPSPPP